jgi:hypothetical protein
VLGFVPAQRGPSGAAGPFKLVRWVLRDDWPDDHGRADVNINEDAVWTKSHVDALATPSLFF